MGFIEETGAAQYVRDVRITTIYEGTTGIQSNDLIGRKLGRDGGAAMAALLMDMERELQAVPAADAGVAGIRAAALDGVRLLRDATAALLGCPRHAPRRRHGSLGAVPETVRLRHRRLAARQVCRAGRRQAVRAGARVLRRQGPYRRLLRRAGAAASPPRWRAWCSRAARASSTPTPRSSERVRGDGVNRREFLAGVNLMAAAAVTSGVRAASDGAIRRRIPSSGEELPVIGLGTSGPFEVGAAEAERAPLREVLQAFFAGGGRLIDTSPMYSTAEGVLGDLLTPDMQARAFMATKVWTRGARSGHRADDALAAGAQARAPRPDPGAQPAGPRHAAADAARLEGGGQGALPRGHALHRRCARRPDPGADARAARLRAVQLLPGHARGRGAPAAARRRARRRGAGQPPVRGRRAVPRRARQAAAGLGGGAAALPAGDSWR